jgi:DNA modification methylase
VALVIQSATTFVEHVRRYPPRRVIIWGKSGWSSYAYRWNPIYVYSDLPDVNRHIWTDLIGVAALATPPSERAHKYQDPLQLYQLLLGMFEHYDRVFDPFMGSGTAGLAAKHFRMDFWGTEIDPTHYKTACDRLEYEPGEAGKSSAETNNLQTVIA